MFERVSELNNLSRFGLSWETGVKGVHKEVLGAWDGHSWRMLCPIVLSHSSTNNCSQIVYEILFVYFGKDQ